MATSNPKLSQLQALSTGLSKYLASTTLVLGGESYTAKQVVALVNPLLDAHDAKVQAKAAFEEAVAAERKLYAANGEVLMEVRRNLAMIFSNAPPTLAALELTARKLPKPLTGEAITAKSAKARATRVARGTASKKAKAAVSGNVSGVTITPVTAGAAPVAASSAQPAASNAVVLGLTPVPHA